MISAALLLAALAAAPRPTYYRPVAVAPVTSGAPFYRLLTATMRHCAVAPYVTPVAAWGSAPATPSCPAGTQPLPDRAAYCVAWRAALVDPGVTAEVEAMLRRSQCAGE